MLALAEQELVMVAPERVPPVLVPPELLAPQEAVLQLFAAAADAARPFSRALGSMIEQFSGGLRWGSPTS